MYKKLLNLKLIKIIFNDLLYYLYPPIFTKMGLEDNLLICYEVFLQINFYFLMQVLTQSLYNNVSFYRLVHLKKPFLKKIKYYTYNF